MDISINVNGKIYGLNVNPYERLIDVLRDRLNITSVKEGCSEGECGACTVLLDNKPILSCLTLAFQADGKSIVTVDGLGNISDLSIIQKAFVDNGAIQCGFCTPGMVMSAVGLLMENPNPSEEEIREAIAGNLCRCTGYVKVIEAVKQASKEIYSAINKGEDKCHERV